MVRGGMYRFYVFGGVIVVLFISLIRVFMIVFRVFFGFIGLYRYFFLSRFFIVFSILFVEGFVYLGKFVVKVLGVGGLLRLVGVVREEFFFIVIFVVIKEVVVVSMVG